jgi:fumarate reductase subunit D
MRREAEERRPDWVAGLAWATFANTAVITALIVPATIVGIGILGPLGVQMWDLRYASFAGGLGNWLVKLFLFVLLATAFYTAAHRMRYVLPELRVMHKGPASVLCLGLAGVATVAAIYLLVTTP